MVGVGVSQQPPAELLVAVLQKLEASLLYKCLQSDYAVGSIGKGGLVGNQINFMRVGSRSSSDGCRGCVRVFEGKFLFCLNFPHAHSD